MIDRKKQSLLCKRRHNLLKRKTASEKMFEQILIKEKIKYISQKGFFINKDKNFCIVDFYLPKPYKIAFEIDGEYHEAEETKRYDLFKERMLLKRKVRVIRLKNKEITENLDIKKIIG